MWSKLSRLSYNQLLLLSWFLKHPNEFGEVNKIAKETKLVSKSLGGVLSSLSRSKFRGIPMIEPWGRAKNGPGLRWKLSNTTHTMIDSKKEVQRLLSKYK